MKIIAVSDLHGNLPTDIPKCDLLIIGGDICPHFDRKPGTMRDVVGQSAWLDTYWRNWLKHVPANRIVAVWGNHDFVGLHPELVPVLPWWLLEDRKITIDGLRIYGTPYTPRFYDWCFMLTEEQLKEKFYYLPEKLDILISHGPPLWTRDRNRSGDHCGSESLHKQLITMLHPPKAVVCGHIHDDRGFGLARRVDGSGVPIWNVSSVDDAYSPHDQMWTEIEL